MRCLVEFDCTNAVVRLEADTVFCEEPQQNMTELSVLRIFPLKVDASVRLCQSCQLPMLYEGEVCEIRFFSIKATSSALTQINFKLYLK